MDLTNIKEVLINYIPWLATVIAFIASATGVILNLRNLLKKSNIEEIKEQIKDENTAIGKQFAELKELHMQLLQENRELIEYNRKLLGELKRVADYDEEQSD